MSKNFKKEDKFEIGIISYNINTRYSNFGAALHSYAFQKFLDKNDVSNVIIDYMLPFGKPKTLKAFLTKFSYYIPRMIKKYKFNKFFRENCVITKNKYDINTLENLTSINKYVCETDVTWALRLGDFDRAFMCDLANMKDKDNVAYSVDFRSKIFSKENEGKLKTYSENFKYISIRNIFKLDYIKNLTKREDISITIDSTLLLDKEDYLPIIKKKNKKENYLLVYNCADHNQAMIEEAKKYAKAKNLKLKIINSIEKNLSIRRCYAQMLSPIGIEDFLGEIDGATHFFTNSYHGICFAIIFGIPFTAFSRKIEPEKIMTILTHFDMQERLFTENKQILETIDTEKIKERMLKLRAESIEFINKSILNK